MEHQKQKQQLLDSCKSESNSSDKIEDDSIGNWSRLIRLLTNCVLFRIGGQWR